MVLSANVTNYDSFNERTRGTYLICFWTSINRIMTHWPSHCSLRWLNRELGIGITDANDGRKTVLSPVFHFYYDIKVCVLKGKRNIIDCSCHAARNRLHICWLFTFRRLSRAAAAMQSISGTVSVCCYDNPQYIVDIVSALQIHKRR